MKVSPKVLIIEDEPLVRMVHEKMLFEIGCHVNTAANAKEALAMITNNYDFVLLDIGLPDMDGIELAVEIRRREGIQKHASIIIVTAYTDKNLKHKCFSIGINQILNKPINIKELKKLVT